MAVIPRFGAIILCGGQSRRMGFSKALLPFGKKTMIENAIHILGQIASELLWLHLQIRFYLKLNLK